MWVNSTSHSGRQGTRGEAVWRNTSSQSVVDVVVRLKVVLVKSRHSGTLELLSAVRHNVSQVIVGKHAVQALVVHGNQLVDPVNCKWRHGLGIQVSHLTKVRLLRNKINVRHKLLRLHVLPHLHITEGMVGRGKQRREDTLEPASVLWMHIDTLFVNKVVCQVQWQLVCPNIQTVVMRRSIRQSLQQVVGVGQLCVVEQGDSWLRICNRAACRAGEPSETGEVGEVKHPGLLKPMMEKKKKLNKMRKAGLLIFLFFYTMGGRGKLILMAWGVHIKGGDNPVSSRELGSQKKNADYTS